MKQYGDEELSVIAEIARMYYVEGISQIEIANMLFFSKAKVSRALRIAREENIVEFHINYPLKRSMKLETELKRKFGLQDARVVVDLYGNESTDISIKRIGEMAAGYRRFVLGQDHVSDHQEHCALWAEENPGGTGRGQFHRQL